MDPRGSAGCDSSSAPSQPHQVTWARSECARGSHGAVTPRVPSVRATLRHAKRGVTTTLAPLHANSRPALFRPVAVLRSVMRLRLAMRLRPGMRLRPAIGLCPALNRAAPTRCQRGETPLPRRSPGPHAVARLVSQPGARLRRFIRSPAASRGEILCVAFIRQAPFPQSSPPQGHLSLWAGCVDRCRVGSSAMGTCVQHLVRALPVTKRTWMFRVRGRTYPI
jgi:hypothetical protein